MHRTVSDLLRTGGVLVYTSPQTTVADAAKKMVNHNVGSILIMENNLKLAGIFTERDLLSRVITAGRDPRQTLISEVMTRDVLVVPSNTPCSDVVQLMDQQHIRHVPVADGERLLGVISLRDLLRYDNSEKHFEIEQLREYVIAKPYPTYPG